MNHSVRDVKESVEATERSNNLGSQIDVITDQADEMSSKRS
ncbi:MULTISPECIES: hypothetical protein [Bacillaceae]|nr:MULTISPECIES: hypothetical protein [Bacillaceae]